MTRWPSGVPRPFLVAIVLPVVFTCVVLLAMTRNRREVWSEVTLTERDVTVDAGDANNSGVALWLTWAGEPRTRSPWLSRAALDALGFATAAPPEATAFFARQLPRTAYVAFALTPQADGRSRLQPVDASRDASALRARYGGRAIVLAGTIGIQTVAGDGGVTFVDGVVLGVDPRRIHVPSELASRLATTAAGAATPGLRVTIRYGARQEPWVVGLN